MRRYEVLIHEAELMAMPPQAVAAELKRRAGHPRDDAREDPVDEETENALRSRNDPILNLALARYGQHMEVVSALFKSAAPGSPIRLACLANMVVGRVTLLNFWSPFPMGLFGVQLTDNDPSPVVQWLVSATSAELTALFSNPTLRDAFLVQVLERNNGWQGIPDGTLCTIVLILSRNALMRESEHGTPNSEYRSRTKKFDVLWNLAETVPVTEEWAVALGLLYERLTPIQSASITDPLVVATRWNADRAATDANEQQSKLRAKGQLCNKDLVRKGLARLALTKDGELLPALLASDDVAFRAAAYAEGPLTAEQLLAGEEKDGELAYSQAVDNVFLWKNHGTRQALRDIADPGLHRAKEDQMRKKHPAWFADDPLYPPDEADQAPLTRADLFAMSAQVAGQSRGLSEVLQTLQGLRNWTGWIWWFSLGALVATLWPS